MNKIFTILSVSTFLLLILLKPNIIFAEEKNQTSITTNEYEVLKDLSKNSNTNLKLNGYNDQDINKIKNVEKEYPKHLNEYKDLPEENLKELGYTDNQIKLLRDYKGTEEETIKLAATMDFRLTENFVNYSQSHDKTEAKFNYRFAWHGVPLMKTKDIVGVAWNDWNLTSTYSYVRYIDIIGNLQNAFTLDATFVNNEGPHSFGGGYRFKMTQEDNYYWAQAGFGSFTMYNHGPKNLSAYAEYGHSTFSLNPTFSVPGGLSIAFSKNVKTMGSDHLDISILP